MSPPPITPAPCAVGFATRLAVHGDRPAIVGPDARLTYRELARRVAATTERLGTTRRLVLLAGANHVDAVATYLAALAGGHPLLLAPGDHPQALESLVSAYHPDVVVRRSGTAWTFDERHDGTAHELHPELALLLTTSGTTGSPKLVRLSQDNLESNAAAIASYLDLRPTDRAATTLPMHYCYGLSVLNSHLLCGATVVLTELSVVDACFWERFRDERCTSFAGVPYTFDLLDRVGFADFDLPHLRYVTQAGGRLAPERVRRYAELGRRRGWDFFVMYGQTEATARMAYLPPDLAATRPAAIGVPIPGGAFSLDPVPGAEAGVGELAYTGPNVMLGYAESPADLARGRTVDVLRTGDLARRSADGLYELVGRRSRFAKLFGLRVDLDAAEALFARHGHTVHCTSCDGRLVVAGASDAAVLRRIAREELGLPPSAVVVPAVPEVARLPSGKPDYGALERLAAAATRRPASAGGSGSLRALFAQVLDRPDVSDDDSFVALGGDSLSYVEMSVRLEAALGHLPVDWHLRPIRELAGSARRARTWSRWRRVETGVLLRALAVILIVGTHATLYRIPGTAHLLVALAGFNFARFQLTPASRRHRVRGQLAGIARIVAPTIAWVALASTWSDDYGLANALLLNAVVGPETWSSQWHFWFVEVLTYLLVGLAALSAVPWLDRLERRRPFGLAAGVAVAALVTRYDVVQVGLVHPKPVLWLFGFGWAVARATRVRHRLLLTAFALGTVPGFFGSRMRECVLATGLLLLTWVPTVRCPAVLTRVVVVLASASLHVYLTQWQVYPHLMRRSPLLAVLASLAAGIGYWFVATRVTAALSRRRSTTRHGAAPPHSSLRL